MSRRPAEQPAARLLAGTFIWLVIFHVPYPILLAIAVAILDLVPVDARLAICGAHLSGLPLSADLIRLGGTLHQRTRTAPGYRMIRLPGPGLPRPGLLPSGDGPPGGLAVEVWELPHHAVGALLETVPAPLSLGRLRLSDGSEVAGFLTAGPDGPPGAHDVSAYGGWRAYLASC